MSTLDGGKWSALVFGRFTPRKIALRSQYTGAWVDLGEKSFVPDGIRNMVFPRPSTQ
jgi:hypothetical protein